MKHLRLVWQFSMAWLVLVALMACASSGTPTPPSSPAPTMPALPTMAPAGATILPSDLGKAQPTAPGAEVTAEATPPPVPTPSVVSYDFAMRPQFANELNTVQNKTLYRIRWDLNEAGDTITGSQRVSFANRTGEPLDEIYFRLFANYPGSAGEIAIDAIRVGGDGVTPQLEVQDTALRVPLFRPLAPERIVQMDLEYRITIPSNNEVRYSDFNRADWITTLPTVYPVIPAYGEDGWHLELPPAYGDLVHADSSVYDLVINTPQEVNVIASGELVEELPVGERVTRRFVGAPMRDLNVNLSQSLAQSETQVDDVTIRSWYQPAHTEQGEKAMQWTADAFRIFEERFGPYPFKELELVETPTTAGGIEYPGVITVASSLYADPQQENYFEFATVHETAHQWWYSTVGNDQVNHPWLDEALTQAAVMVYFEDTYGVETAREIQANYFDKQYEDAKEKYGDRPSGLPVGDYDQDAYGAFIYAKAPKFFQAVREQIGDEAFFAALQNYYRDFKFRIAQPEDLLSAFRETGGGGVDALYEQWIGGS